MSLRTTIREWGRAFIYLDFLGAIAWSRVVAVVGSLAIGLFLILGRDDQAANLTPSVLGAAALLVFLAWITYDAHRSRERIHKYHVKEAVPTPEGDMSEVVNLPKMPPWMG